MSSAGAHRALRGAGAQPARRVHEAPAPPRRRGRPRLRIVPQPRERRRRRLPFLVLSALLVAALVVGVVSVQAYVAQTSFKMKDLSKRTEDLRTSYGELRLQVAMLSSPERIAQQAAGFGMLLPQDVQVVVAIEPRGRPPRPAPATAPAAADGPIGGHP